MVDSVLVGRCSLMDLKLREEIDSYHYKLLLSTWYLLPRLNDTGMSRIFYDFHIELSEMELIVLK